MVSAARSEDGVNFGPRAVKGSARLANVLDRLAEGRALMADVPISGWRGVVEPDQREGGSSPSTGPSGPARKEAGLSRPGAHMSISLYG